MLTMPEPLLKIIYQIQQSLKAELVLRISETTLIEVAKLKKRQNLFSLVRVEPRRYL